MRVAVASIVLLVFGIGCVPSPVLDGTYSNSGLPVSGSGGTLLFLFKNDPNLVFSPSEKWDISINGEKVATIYEETHAKLELGIGNYTIEASKSNIFNNSSVGKFIQRLLSSQEDTVGLPLELNIDKPGTVEFVRLSLQSTTYLEGMEVIDNVAVGRYVTSHGATLRLIDKDRANALLQNTRSIALTERLSE